MKANAAGSLMRMLLAMVIAPFLSSCLSAAPLALSAYAAPAKVAHGDWIERADVMAMPAFPNDGALVSQNPPFISWPRIASADGYSVEVLRGTAVQASGVVKNNWFQPPAVFKTGSYRWRVQPLQSGKPFSTASDWRQFSVVGADSGLLLPNSTTLTNSVTAIAHPRTFPRSTELASIQSLATGSRAKQLAALRSRVLLASSRPMLAEPVQPKALTVRAAAMNTLDLPQYVAPEIKQILEAAFLWRIEGNKAAFDDGRRRALSLAAWDVNGITAYEPNHHAPRQVMWALAVAYDWLYDGLKESERNQLRDTTNARLIQMESSLVAPELGLFARPFNSHGWVALNAAAATSAILVGDTPESTRLFQLFVPWSLQAVSTWGGEDGGFGNGTAYAAWNMDPILPYWDAIRLATGLNPFNRSWAENLGMYYLYFLPPGTPSGAFGEAADYAPDARYLAPYLQRVNSPLYRWYFNEQDNQFQSWLVQLISTVSASSAPFPTGTPNGAVFPSIGWAAMHSSLPDKNRTSIYFKSSPYGSFNHSHADQNSFVINAKGKRLAIDSGYYDWYGSPHWANWYKQTIAHNAISFDGGQGQLINRKDASGEITYFNSTATYDSVGGNAVKAYGGALARAQRDLVYLRPGLVLVYDALESAIPRFWEWNIHAVNRMNHLSNTSIELVNGDARVCIDILAAPKMAFAQSDQFSADPDKPAGSWVKQWHGRFASSSVSTRAEIIALLRMDCVGASGVSVRRVAADMVVTAGSHVISFAPGKAASVQ